MAGSASASTRAREAYFLEYARTVREIAGECRWRSPADSRPAPPCRKRVQAGDCDMVGIARPAAEAPDAADAILSQRLPVLTTRELSYGIPSVLKVINGKTLDGLLNIGWHTDQLHRMGAGKQPDLKRGRLATTIALLRRNGTISFRPKRGVR